MTDGVRFRLVAGGHASAALAAIDLRAPDGAAMDRTLNSLGPGRSDPGSVTLRAFGDADRGLVARWSDTAATLFPHSGPAVLNGVREWLERAGAVEDDSTDPRGIYAEAPDLVEACALDAIARADSPLAIDAVLAQLDLWRRHNSGATIPDMDPDSQRRLDRLLVAPIVALVGAPNIGKSSLTNALARRSVSVVADQPGTTRDHVGVTMEFGGLAARWVDTPGLRRPPCDAIDQRAADIARSVIARADLVIECIDAHAPAEDRPWSEAIGASAERLEVLTRCDRIPSQFEASEAVAIRTSARTGEGLTRLASRVRDVLVPPALLNHSQRWRFHPRLG